MDMLPSYSFAVKTLIQVFFLLDCPLYDPMKSEEVSYVWWKSADDRK